MKFWPQWPQNRPLNFSSHNLWNWSGLAVLVKLVDPRTPRIFFILSARLHILNGMSKMTLPKYLLQFFSLISGSLSRWCEQICKFTDHSAFPQNKSNCVSWLNENFGQIHSKLCEINSGFVPRFRCLIWWTSWWTFLSEHEWALESAANFKTCQWPPAVFRNHYYLKTPF